MENPFSGHSHRVLFGNMEKKPRHCWYCLVWKQKLKWKDLSKKGWYFSIPILPIDHFCQHIWTLNFRVHWTRESPRLSGALGTKTFCSMFLICAIYFIIQWYLYLVTFVWEPSSPRRMDYNTTKTERFFSPASPPAEENNGVPQAHSHCSSQPHQHHMREMHPEHANKMSVVHLEYMSWAL